MDARAAVLAKASESVGMRERTGNNDIVFADEWHITGQAWCMAFVQSCFHYAGVPLPHQSLYCPYVVQWARDHGEAVEVGEGDPIPGDIVLFSWDMRAWPRHRNGTGDHVGIVERWDGGDTVHTIEGNISPEGGGSQGVWRRRRSISGTVVCFWRPSVYDDLPEEPDMTPEERQWLQEAHGSIGLLHQILATARPAITFVNDPRDGAVYLVWGTMWKRHITSGETLENFRGFWGARGADVHVHDWRPEEIDSVPFAGSSTEYSKPPAPTVERVVDVDASLQQADAQQLMAALMVRLGQQKAS